MARRMILSGYLFEEHRGPWLLLDCLDTASTERQAFAIRGKVFTLKRFRARYCVGRYDLATFAASPCPNRSPVGLGQSPCPACEQACGFNPAFYRIPREQLSSQQRAYNARPHLVYLAHFGDSTLKVGISSTDRAVTRLREQGARLALTVATVADAYAARIIETAVNQQLGLPEVMRNERKRALLNVRFDSAAARRELEQARRSIAESLNLRVSSSDAVDNAEAFVGDSLLDLPITDVSDTSPLHVSGRSIGLIGDIMIVEQAGRQYMVSLKRFLSHVVELTDAEQPNAVPPAPSQLRLL